MPPSLTITLVVPTAASSSGEVVKVEAVAATRVESPPVSAERAEEHKKCSLVVYSYVTQLFMI
jgi:hypothetical protein